MSFPLVVAASEVFSSIESLVVMIVIGGLIGWAASRLMKADGQMGLLANIGVGIVGSALGSWLAGELGISLGGGWVGRILIALGGAVLLIVILRLLKVLR